MSDEEIETVFGMYIAAGMQAFALDLTYLEVMHETAERLQLKREASRKKAEASRPHTKG